MLSTNMKNALFKRLDTEVFQGLDKLKTHPNYQSFLDFYTNLEDDQQKDRQGRKIKAKRAR